MTDIIHILASTRTGHEFAEVDAINDMGPLAFTPRRVQITVAAAGKPERIDYLPLLPRLLFIACTEVEWHRIATKRIVWESRALPPIRRVLEIPPRAWAGCQEFAARAEQECLYRIGLHEAGKKVRNLRKGDIVRMIAGCIGDVELAGRMGRVVGVKAGLVEVTTDVQIMGKSVTARVGAMDLVME